MTRPTKMQNYLRGFLPWQSEFDYFFACWANNHNGWSKMKKKNRRIAKRRERRTWEKDVETTFVQNAMESENLQKQVD